MTRMTCPDKGASFSRTILKVLRLGERLRHLPWRDHPPPGAVARVEEFPAAGVANLEAPGVHSAEHSNWKSSRHFWVATWSCSTHGGAVRFGVSISNRTPIRQVSAWGLDQFKFSRSRLGTARLGSFEQCWVAGYIFDPKLSHHPLHILGAEANSIRMFVAELTRARDPRIWVARIWHKGRGSRLMNDALRSNIELVPSN
jgi:hypothetical protein